MIEILAIVHFGLFVVMVIIMKTHAKMKDSKDLYKHKDNDPRVRTGT